jgi:hypothetical protein
MPYEQFIWNRFAKLKISSILVESIQKVAKYIYNAENWMLFGQQCEPSLVPDQWSDSCPSLYNSIEKYQTLLHFKAFQSIVSLLS